jgi:hypothetical protein
VNIVLRQQLSSKYPELVKQIKIMIEVTSIMVLLLFTGICIYQFFFFSHIAIFKIPLLMFNVKAISFIVWSSFSLTVLRYIWKWKFLIVMIPLYALSDLFWNIEQFINVGRCLIQNTYSTVDFQYYFFIMCCIVPIALVIISPIQINKDRPYHYIRIIVFVIWSIFYIFILHIPVILQVCGGILIPSNWPYEALWQVVFLLCFIDIIKPRVDKIETKQEIKKI